MKIEVPEYKFNLYPEQGLVYCWHWENDMTACKIGKSTVKSIVNVLSGYSCWNYKKLVLLGFEICDDSSVAYIRETELHERFNLVNPKYEWVYLDDSVIDWLENDCYIVPTDRFLKGRYILETEQHEKPEVKMYVKITDDRHNVIQFYNSGLTIKQIAEKYGCKTSQVRKVLRQRVVR